MHMLRTGLVVALMLGGSLPAGAKADLPLIDAVRRGDLAAVRALLESDAARTGVDAPAADGSTALHWAVHEQRLVLVELLLDAGADVTLANRHGVSAAWLAAENGDAVVLERLLDAGADSNTAMPGGETLLMTAARTGDPDAVRLLVARGADPNASESLRGQTALMWAAARNNAAAIHVLAEVGADVHARTDNPSPVAGRTFASTPATGFTPLLFAVRGGHLDAARVLLDAGADVNDTVSDGQSALVVAAANANWEMAAYLLDRGADPTHAAAGWNALHQAVRTRRMNIGFGTPGPFAAGTLDSLDLIRKLLSHGVDVNARMTRNGMRDGQRNRLNRLGATAFLLAAKVTDVDVMRVLIEAGADTSMPTADGTTPLMVAAGLAIWNPGEDGGSLSGQEDEVLEAVTICVETGNDVRAANYRDETALHGAGFRGANNVVDYLVEQGADLDARTVDGWSPLAIARGLSYSDFYKAQVHTAGRLEALMTTRGTATEGDAHHVPGAVCYDCLQTHRDQIRFVADRDERMEAAFDPTDRGIQVPAPASSR
jgi:ankyrin repeat protein